MKNDLEINNLIIDGNWLAFRCHSVNENNMIDEFINKTHRLRDIYNPENTHVVWDLPGSSLYRKNIYEDYKKSRKEKDPSFIINLHFLFKNVGDFGMYQWIPCFGEGDDCIATLCEKIGQDKKILIYSIDKDFLQLVKNNIFLLKPINNKDALICENNIKDIVIKYNGKEISGLDADGWLDFQTLVGDNVDGVKGIDGIGPMKAISMLKEVPCVVNAILEENDKYRKIDWFNEMIKKKYELRKMRSLVMLKNNIKIMRIYKYI